MRTSPPLAGATLLVALAACTAGSPLTDTPRRVSPEEVAVAGIASHPTSDDVGEMGGDLAVGEEVTGLTMFRGNPSRTYYGEGPIPTEMPVNWRYPDSPMCANSPVGPDDRPIGDIDKWWCGSGWTGQPVVWERPDGITEVIVGTFDTHIHFIDAATGENTRPSFPMGDIIKGSVTLDPDGYPLLYSGSRGPLFRIIALDRDEPVEMWSMSADDRPGMWNIDWDANPVIVDGVMYQGGENSWWFAVELNRGRDEHGLVTIDPEIVFDMPAFTEELVDAVGDNQSVESSTAVHDGRAYFANSAGRVVGVDISRLPDGEASVVFDYWTGDDTDATPVVDADGYLYIASQVDHGTSRGAEVGQLIKLDPNDPGDDPLIWSIDVPGTSVDGGIWATPALVDDVLFAATNPGDLLAVDTATGEVLWSDEIGVHAWSSPVYADGRLLVAVHCDTAPALRVYDVSSPRSPVQIAEEGFADGCIESTPAVWKGQVFVGSRDGYLYAVGDGG